MRDVFLIYLFLYNLSGCANQSLFNSLVYCIAILSLIIEANNSLIGKILLSYNLKMSLFVNKNKDKIDKTYIFILVLD